MPTFGSEEEYRARRGDANFWGPCVTGILRRHGLPGHEFVAGFNPTFPTFVCGDHVVKLFGFTPAWRSILEAERSAYHRIAADPRIVAPRIVAEGVAEWPYLVTTRVPGRSLGDAALTSEQRVAVAAELGDQVRRIHALAPGPAWHPLPDIAAAAHRSSLPSHLAAQASAFFDRLGPDDPVFVHGDLCGMHAFVEEGRLSGIIDWGDATSADRHYEIIQIFRDTFECDDELLRVFLDASDWPVTADFPRRALGQALLRQATGLEQHLGMDVFEPIAQKHPLDEIATLDELAETLFAP
ncbi:MAG: aminoglycoside phosphotransferase family protein [Planctomycetota bacterium]|jgi:hypothetical protein